MKRLLSGLLCCWSLFSLGQDEVHLLVTNMDDEALAFSTLGVQKTDSTYTIEHYTDLSGRVQIPFPTDGVPRCIQHLGYIPTCLHFEKPGFYQVRLEVDVTELHAYEVVHQTTRKNNSNKELVTLIDKSDWETQGETNLRGALKNHAGVRFQMDPILGSSISLQGLSGKYIEVLEDGVPVSGSVNGQVDFSQFTLADLEQIEIQEGAQASCSALGGSINLVSNKRLNHAVQIYGETVGWERINLQTGVEKGATRLQISAGQEYLKGYSENNDTRQHDWKPKFSWFFKPRLQIQLPKGLIKLFTHHTSDRILNRGAAYGVYKNRAQDTRYHNLRTRTGLHYKHYFQPKVTLLSQVNFLTSERRKTTVYKNLETLTETEMHDPLKSDSLSYRSINGKMELKKQQDRISISLGADFENEMGDNQRLQSGTNQSAFIYSEQHWKVSPSISLKTGLRKGWNSGGTIPFTPSLQIRYGSTRWFGLLSFSQGYRIPTLQERYYRFVDINHNIQGNPALLPESSTSWNGKWGFSVSENLQLRASAYAHTIQDQIVLAAQNSFEFTYQNSQFFKGKGAFLGLATQVHNWNLDLQGGITHTHYPSAQFTSWESQIQLQYNPNNDCQLGLNYRYQSASPYLLSSGDQLSIVSSPDFHFLDGQIHLSQLLPQLSVTLGAKNLLNLTSFNAVGTGTAHAVSGNQLIQWGRSYFIQLQYQFNKANKQ